MMEKAESFASVWDAIEETPADARVMEMRCILMSVIEHHVRRKRWSRRVAARRLGVTQRRAADMVKGRNTDLDVESLARMAVTAGLTVHLSVADVG